MLSLVIAAILAVSLTACGGPSGGDVREPSNVQTSEAGSEETPQPERSEAPEKESEKEPEKTAAAIDEAVLVDESGVKITAKSLDAGGFLGAEVKLLIENDSGKDLTFQCRNSSVNGYMVETMMSVDVVDGKKANDGLIFMSSDLEACGIETIADMEFSFHIFTTQDWETYLDTPLIQLKTSAADTYEYTYDDSGNLAYDGNDIKAVIRGLSEDSIFGPGIVVYIENHGNRDTTVQVRDVSVNGFMVQTLFSSDVGAGKHAVDTITFLSSELEENDITEIENVELSFHIFDTATWDTIADTDTIAITF